MKLPGLMNHTFSNVPRAEIPRAQFNRSHGYKTTFDSGYLVPVFVDEALPGDTFNCRMTAFTRMATPLHPFMDNLYLDTFFFAVPVRLVFDNWQKMMGEQVNPGDSTDYLTPTMTSPSGGHLVGSLSDYMGIPTEVSNLTHTSLWHRAYNLIWNEWFRDQNLQDSVVVDLDDGPDNPSDYVLLKRGKRHDYFTSALPWPQKGEAVDLPLGGTAPVKSYSDNTFSDTQTFHSSYVNALASNEHVVRSANDGTWFAADLEEATAATINQLRQAFQIQKLYERDARGGTRYIEIIQSHFGVTSPDARLQRPEYLGGGSVMINVNPIAQTSSTDEITPQGNLAAMATGSVHGHGFVKSFTEHTLILGFVNVRADLTYQQGLNRMFSRQTRWDYYWPALAHLGEQAILNKEIYAQGSAVVDGNGDPVDDNVFGYQESFAEMRYKPSLITGKFRSSYSQSLDSWHLSQDFDSLPVLNDEFIEENPPVSRVISVQNEPEFLFDAYFDLKCARPMPVYSVPGLIDHF
jgi:hypothetical protein